jgi:hypothetical protein
MGKNKAQVAAEARAEQPKAKQERLLALEEEIGKRKLGTTLQELGKRDVIRMSEAELDSAIKEREVLLSEPKAEVKTPATPVPPSKQMQTIAKLTLAFKEQRQIEIVESMTKQDGKYILINIGAGWPTIRIGSNGGVVLPEIRSYKEGMDTWVKADELLARQTAREAKKSAAATTPAPKAAEKQQATA